MYCFLHAKVCGPVVNNHLCNIRVSSNKIIKTDLKLTWIPMGAEAERNRKNNFQHFTIRNLDRDMNHYGMGQDA